MSEWLKEHAWKACVGETLPRVQIPLSPPTFALARVVGARCRQTTARRSPRLGSNPSLSATTILEVLKERIQQAAMSTRDRSARWKAWRTAAAAVATGGASGRTRWTLYKPTTGS